MIKIQSLIIIALTCPIVQAEFVLAESPPDNVTVVTDRMTKEQKMALYVSSSKSHTQASRNSDIIMWVRFKRWQAETKEIPDDKNMFLTWQKNKQYNDNELSKFTEWKNSDDYRLWQKTKSFWNGNSQTNNEKVGQAAGEHAKAFIQGKVIKTGQDGQNVVVKLRDNTLISGKLVKTTEVQYQIKTDDNLEIVQKKDVIFIQTIDTQVKPTQLLEDEPEDQTSR